MTKCEHHPAARIVNDQCTICWAGGCDCSTLPCVHGGDPPPRKTSPPGGQVAPVPMVLHCPECRTRHIDEGEFATKIHHTHSCQGCGLTWRPAVVPTVGVQFLPGFKNEVSMSKCDDPEMVKLCQELLNATASLSSGPYVISAALAVLKRSVEAPAPTDTLPGLVMLRSLIKDVEKRRVSATVAIALARYYAEGVMMEEMVELVSKYPILCDCSVCSASPPDKRGHAHNCRCPSCKD